MCHHHRWYRALAGRADPADKGAPLVHDGIVSVSVTHFRPLVPSPATPSCIVWSRKIPNGYLSTPGRYNSQLASGAHGSVYPAGST